MLKYQIHKEKLAGCKNLEFMQEFRIHKNRESKYGKKRR